MDSTEYLTPAEILAGRVAADALACSCVRRESRSYRQTGSRSETCPVHNQTEQRRRAGLLRRRVRS